MPGTRRQISGNSLTTVMLKSNADGPGMQDRDWVLPQVYLRLPHLTRPAK